MARRAPKHNGWGAWKCLVGELRTVCYGKSNTSGISSIARKGNRTMTTCLFDDIRTTLGTNAISQFLLYKHIIRQSLRIDNC